MINGERYLVNTDRSYTMPDGNEYKAFWGTCFVEPIDTLTGIKPMPREVNWYCKMNNVMIAGCDIHCWVRCDTPPPKTSRAVWSTVLAGPISLINIYFTDPAEITVTLEEKNFVK